MTIYKDKHITIYRVNLLTMSIYIVNLLTVYKAGLIAPN